MKRVALLGLYHEANTFSGRRADLADFTAGGLTSGEDLVRRFSGTASTVGGYLQASERHGFDVVPVGFARVNPTGPITRRAASHLCAVFQSGLRAGGPPDAVLLAMHGAGVMEDDPDADGRVAELVRGIVGPGVPIGAVLDMHANPTQRFIDAVDVALAYQTNPHLDAHLQAGAVADLVAARLNGTLEAPHLYLRPLPVAVNILRQGTADEPMRSLLDSAARAVADDPSLYALQIVEGYPYADVPHMGMSILTLAANAETAKRQSALLASLIWERRAELQADALGARAAIAHVARQIDERYVLLDVGDNIGAGAPGDSTELLHAARQARQPLLLTLHDSEAAAACHRSRNGARVRLALGGKKPDTPCPPVTALATIRHLSDGRYEEPAPTHGGFQHFDAGLTATVDLEDGSTVVLTSRLVPNTSTHQFRAAGARPEDYRVIVAKGVNAPRAAYAELRAHFLPVATSGVTAADYSRLPYRNRRRPMYPYEPETTLDLQVR